MYKVREKREDRGRMMKGEEERKDEESDGRGPTCG